MCACPRPGVNASIQVRTALVVSLETCMLCPCRQIMRPICHNPDKVQFHLLQWIRKRKQPAKMAKNSNTHVK